MNGKKVLHGIGKRICPYEVMEGEFSEGKLNGFGRVICGDTYAIGFWKRGRLHGYGVRIKEEEEPEEGYWESAGLMSGKMTKSKADIKEFNPYVDRCAGKIDYEKYQIDPPPLKYSESVHKIIDEDGTFAQGKEIDWLNSPTPTEETELSKSSLFPSGSDIIPSTHSTMDTFDDLDGTERERTPDTSSTTDTE